VIKEEHMDERAELPSRSWRIYALGTAITLPIFYVLSCGPAMMIPQSKTLDLIDGEHVVLYARHGYGSTTKPPAIYLPTEFVQWFYSSADALVFLRHSDFEFRISLDIRP
jgi:hypothetical protein